MSKLIIRLRLLLASWLVGNHTLIKNVTLLRHDSILFIEHGKHFRSSNLKLCDRRSMIRYKEEPLTAI